MRVRLFDNVLRLFRFDNGLELLTQRVLFRRTHVQVHRIKGMEIIADHRGADVGSIRRCITGNMYARFLPQMSLASPVTVLDIGANAGGFSLMLRVRGIQFRRLVCVEMNPNTYERLRFNIRTNLPHVSEVLNAAVVGTPRVIDIDLGWGSTGDSIYHGSAAATGTATAVTAPAHYQIPGRTLDDIVRATIPHQDVIDICKMDIEGAEDEIVLDPGSANASLDRCRYFIVEIHDRDRYDSFLSALHDRGFVKLADEGKHRCGVHLFHNTRLDPLPPATTQTG